MECRSSHAGKGMGRAVALGLGVILPSFAFALPANAGIIANLGTTTNLPASWNSTPDIGTASPNATTSVTPGASALEQTITVGASSLTLGEVDFAVQLATGQSVTMTLSIYAVPDPLTAGFTQGTNLLPGGGSFTYSNATAGTVKGILSLDLTGTDEITLAANTSYAISVKKVSTSPTNFNPTFYDFTNADNASSAYTPGALFYNQQFTQFGGSDGVDAAFAVYAAGTSVPEPASLGILALGGLGLLARRRRH